MVPKVKAGKIFFKANGEQYRAKGAFTFNIGADKTSKILGADKVHGDKVEPVVPFIEGKVTDGDDIDLKSLAVVEGSVTLELLNGKTILITGVSGNSADQDVDTEEGEIPVRFEGDSGEEVKS